MFEFKGPPEPWRWLSPSLAIRSFEGMSGGMSCPVIDVYRLEQGRWTCVHSYQGEGYIDCGFGATYPGPSESAGPWMTRVKQTW
jgi:hypothetical protein